MDSNFQQCNFLATFPLDSVYVISVLVALLVIEVSPIILY